MALPANFVDSSVSNSVRKKPGLTIVVLIPNDYLEGFDGRKVILTF